MVEQYALVSDTELRAEVWNATDGLTRVRCPECRDSFVITDSHGTQDVTMTLADIVAGLRDHACDSAPMSMLHEQLHCVVCSLPISRICKGCGSHWCVKRQCGR